jgi:hypothetical protein
MSMPVPVPVPVLVLVLLRPWVVEGGERARPDSVGGWVHSVVVGSCLGSGRRRRGRLGSGAEVGSQAFSFNLTTRCYSEIYGTSSVVAINTIPTVTS